MNIKKVIHKWSWVLLIAFCFIGSIYPYIGTIALICMLAPVLMAFFKGRMWCGNFCPRGSFNDNILSKISFKRKIPNFIKSVWFRNLFLILLMASFAYQLFYAWGNLVDIGQVFVRMIIITTIITIVLGITFNQRTWCMICPMGTMAHYVSKIKKLKKKHKHVFFEKDSCVGCKVCSKNCPIGIEVLRYKEEGKVSNSDCLKCNLCVEKCPKKSLKIA